MYMGGRCCVLPTLSPSASTVSSFDRLPKSVFVWIMWSVRVVMTSWVSC